MKKGIETFLGSVVPEKYEDYVIDLWKRSEIKVGRWFQGQLLLSLIVGLVVYVGLSIMGVKYALVLGILSMVLEIVPMVGPVLAAIPAVFLGFLQSPGLGLWLIVFYTVVQQLENHILVPLVIGKTTGLNPVVVIMALLIGGSLAGISGMILSVPVATIIVEILDDIAKQKESRRVAV
jgi:predicted PurR-regulated permease PerM